jgi:predicted O-methyltransferase YrrM
MAKCLKKMNDKDASNRQTRKVIGLDVSSDYAEIGKKYWKMAGVDDLIDFRIGDAKHSLSELLKDERYGENSADLCFIDADKTSYDDYYEKCLRLTKSGGLIVVDNTLWGGSVAVPDPILDVLIERANRISEDDDSDQAKVARRARDTKAIKQLTEKIYNDERIERVSFLTIADGVTICRKR